MSSNVIWWKYRVFRAQEGVAELNRRVKEMHPAAPEISDRDVLRLMSRKREVTVDDGVGSKLTLTQGEAKTIDREFRYEITVSFGHGDYGLAEYDAIAQGLAHSLPVAAAIEAIRMEEAGLPPLNVPVVVRRLSEKKPLEKKAPAEEKKVPEKRKSFAESFMEGYNGAKKP